jgi:hypothetical protein
MLGHSSLETTLVYLHTPEGKINEISKKIGELADKDVAEGPRLDSEEKWA